MNLLNQQYSLPIRNPIKCTYQRRSFGCNITNLSMQCNKKVQILRAGSFSLSSSQSRLNKRFFKNQIEQNIFNYLIKTDKENLERYSNSKENQNINININESIQTKIQKFTVLANQTVRIHGLFKLKQQTLHLSLIYLWQYFKNTQISQNNYQKIIITILWSTGKYQQIRTPHLKNYLIFSNNKYQSIQIQQLEKQILITLNYQLCKITLQNYIQFFKEKISNKQEIYYMTCYLCQLALAYCLGQKYANYIIFFAAANLSEMLFRQNTEIRKIREMIKIDYSMISSCIKDLSKLICVNCQQSANNIREKYRQQGKLKVADTKLSKSL